MSGPIPSAVASAAARHAAMAQCHAVINAWAPSKAQSLPAKTWASIPERTRLTLVMIASTQKGEPVRLARQPWASFPEADQCAMAAAARMLLKDLRNAASLF